MTHRLSSTSIAALLGFSTFASGQDPMLQIRAMLNDPAKPDTRFFVGKVGEAMLPLKLAEEGLTDSQMVATENGSLNLFTSATVDQDNPLASLAATVKIPAGSSRLIVVILPLPERTPPYRMVVLNDDAKSFPWGDCFREGRSLAFRKSPSWMNTTVRKRIFITRKQTSGCWRPNAKCNLSTPFAACS
jgi:hypothetical protein